MILATILIAAVASLTAPNQARIAEIATKLPSAPQWAEDGIDAAANVKRADALLKEAEQVIRGSGKSKKRRVSTYGLFWALLGASVTGIAWVVSLYL